jgi:thioredoxin reductase (NADPH)
MTKPTEFEVAVIGGGPAGLSCALWLGRYLHSTVLIDSGDPRNWESTSVNGYLGLPKVHPAALRKRGRTECRRYGVRLIDDAVDRLKKSDTDRFDLLLKNEKHLIVQRVVLAIGLVDYWPDLPGLEHCYGLSAHHCPDCDGYDARGKKTVVIGHGPPAAALAFALATWTSQIIICTNGVPCALPPDLAEKVHALNIPIVETRVKWTHSNERHLRFLELVDGMQIDAEKLFFTVEHVAADDLGAQLGCKRDEAGLIVTDDTRCTSVEYVYGVGDITHGPQLAIRAAADGAIAAATIHRSLLPEARRL